MNEAIVRMRVQEAIDRKLKRLDLGNCDLSELPEEIYELSWIEELILCSQGYLYNFEKKDWEKIVSTNIGTPNKIKSFPAYIKRFKNLKVILANGELSAESKRNPLNDISELKNLPQLEQLNIQSTEVSDLTVLSALKNLKMLHIQKTRVRDVEIESLKYLENLEILDISNNDITGINPLTNTLKLKWLYAQRTYVHNLSPISNLLNIELLVLFKTKIADLSPIENLINLKRLEIDDTNIESLTPISNLIQLEKLNISNTAVYDLSPIVKLNKLKEIKDIGCVITNPSREIYDMGVDSIRRYFKQIETQGGTEELNECKLIIVGEGESGKTTLFEKLRNPNHDVHTNPTDETHGILIHEGLSVIRKIEVVKEKEKPRTGNDLAVLKSWKLQNESELSEELKVNLWDFGGQELQYMTHQFFLSPGALYILVMDSRKESPNSAYWFQIISLLGKYENYNEKVKLLIIFNRKKDSSGEPKHYKTLEYYQDDFEHTFIDIDLSDKGNHWRSLKKTITDKLFELPIVKVQLPKQWRVIREDLKKEAQTKPYITAERFSEICNLRKIPSREDQFLLSSYLHELGSILHFQNDTDLMDLLILKPEWAVKGVYAFLKNREKTERNKGKFKAKDVFDILEKEYSKIDVQKILQLMSKNNFDICYKSREGEFYIAAQLLDNDPPSYFTWNTEATNLYHDIPVLGFCYQYPIIPKGLMSRLIVRLSTYIEVVNDKDVVWKKGAVLNFEKNGSKCRLLMQEEEDSRNGLKQIKIEVLGEPTYRKFALEKVRDEVKDIHKRWFKNIKFDEIIPCSCKNCSSKSNPKDYLLKDLLELWKNSDKKQCNSGAFVDIQQLLEGVYHNNEIKAFERELKNTSEKSWNDRNTDDAFIENDKNEFKVLYLTANPGKQELNFTLENGAIERAIKNSNFKSTWEKQVSRKMFLSSIRKYEPYILHFSGHGSEHGLSFNDDSTSLGKTVSTEEIVSMFDTFKRMNIKIDIVILNSCFSSEQIREVSKLKYIPYLIGTNISVTDPAATDFSEGFYEELVKSGRNIEKSFLWGKTFATTSIEDKDAFFVIYKYDELLNI